MPVPTATDSSETNAAAPPLAIALFGGFSVSVRGVPLRKLRTRQGSRLLALLSLRHEREYGRSALVAQLWPDSPTDEAGRASLRRALTDLRAALGEEAGRITAPSPGSLRFDLSGGAFFDVWEFDKAVRTQTRAGLDRAIALYCGALMPDLDALFDPEGTLQSARERRQMQYLDALEQRAELFERDNDSKGAIADLRRLLAADPLRESAARRLMELLDTQGQRAAALAEYRRLQTSLAAELGVEPEMETQATAQKLQIPRRDRDAPAQNNLPYQATRFIGREHEIRTIHALLKTTRLLTLTGAGGAGKTRLALEIASQAQSEYPESVLLVEMAALSDPLQVPRAIAAVLGVREQTGPSLTQAITAALRNRRLLLVLDNAEHLIGACAEIGGAILRACPHVTLLVTSREPLSLRGELTVPVPSLSLPTCQQMDTATPESLAAFEAVQLFMDRARRVRPDFSLSHANAAAVALLCCRLDGIPLALEMAAARVRALSVEAIVERLHHRFQLLSGGDPTALPQHQTLRALMDWSYHLLDVDEKRLLLRLTRFAGGWTLAAAEHVCSFAPLNKEKIVYLLTRLVDKSLIHVEPVSGEPEANRYRLLETVRQYGEEKRREENVFDAETDAAETERRHSDWCIALAEEAERDFEGAAQNESLNRLHSEHANLRAALDNSLAATEPSARLNGLRLSGALWRFYLLRGYLSEGRAYLDQLLTDWQQWFAQSAFTTSEAANTNVKQIVATALRGAGILTSAQGDYATARVRQEDSLALFREIGDPLGTASASTSLGLAFYSIGDCAAAWQCLNESLQLNRALGNKRGTATALINLGAVAAYGRADYAAACLLYDESLALFREIDDERGVANALKGLGNAALARGDTASAGALLAESLFRFRSMGDLRGITYGLESMATLYHRTPETCALAPCLWGAAHTLRQHRGTPLPHSEQEVQNTEKAFAQATLGEAAWADAFAIGTALHWEQAVDRALGQKSALGIAALSAPDVDALAP